MYTYTRTACVHNTTYERHQHLSRRGMQSSVYKYIPHLGSRSCILVIYAPLKRTKRLITHKLYDCRSFSVQEYWRMQAIKSILLTRHWRVSLSTTQHYHISRRKSQSHTQTFQWWCFVSREMVGHPLLTHNSCHVILYTLAVSPG